MIKQLREHGRPTVDVRRDGVRHPGPRGTRDRCVEQAVVPSWIAFAVTRLLEKHFDSLIDYDFTADMEVDLDAIAAVTTVAWLTRFYCSNGARQRGGRGPARLVGDLGRRRRPRD